jgi:hypothetical protein
MKSFLDGKKSLAVASLVPAAQPMAQHAATTKGGATHDHATSASKAQVEVVKEGDKIVRIYVTCTCGERLEIECLYPAGV